MARCRLLAGTAVLAALVACSAPGVAAAAGEPQIISAGIDAQDRLVATWVLAPGTRFDFVDVATVPISEPRVPNFFAGGNTAAFECAEAKYCEGTETMTSYTGPRLARDRRYYVRVNAVDANETSLTSAVWQIDETKPVIPGRGRRTAGPPTNTPVAGRPYVPPAPETIPPPTLKLIAAPKHIATVLRRGVRARVECPGAECFVIAGLGLGVGRLAGGVDTIRAGGRRTFVLKPSRRSARRLARRTRARLVIEIVIVQPGDKETRLEQALQVIR